MVLLITFVLNCPRNIYSQVILPNFHQTPIGQYSSVEGSAVVARTKMAESLWFNPAGIYDKDKSSVNVSAAAIIFSDIRSNDQASSDHSSIPSFVGGQFKISPKLAFGIGIISMFQQENTSDQFRKKDFDVSNLKNIEIREHRHGFLEDLILGSGISYLLDSKNNFKVGGAIYLHMYEFTKSGFDFLFNTADSNSNFYSGSYGLNIDGKGNMIQGSLGITWNYQFWRFGIVTKTPAWNLKSSGHLRLTSHIRGSNDETTFLVSDDNNLKTKLQLPAELSIGMAYKGKPLQVEFDIKYQFGQKRKNIYETNVISRGQVRSSANTNNSSENIIFDNTYDFDHVINIFIGLRYQISEHYYVHFGGFSDNSPMNDAPKNESFFENLDLYGIRLGITKKYKYIKSTLGLMYNFSETSYINVKERIDNDSYLRRIKLRQYGVTIASSYSF